MTRRIRLRVDVEAVPVADVLAEVAAAFATYPTERGTAVDDRPALVDTATGRTRSTRRSTRTRSAVTRRR